MVKKAGIWEYRNAGMWGKPFWNDAIELYLLACAILLKLPYQLGKVTANSIDAAHSISLNVVEGHCRRSLKEYLNYLNFALGSCGEIRPCC
jgi:four helix bundle protein